MVVIFKDTEAYLQPLKINEGNSFSKKYYFCGGYVFIVLMFSKSKTTKHCRLGDMSVAVLVDAHTYGQIGKAHV